MISTTDTRYWSTGITVRWAHYAGHRPDNTPFSGWGASLSFFDDGFADDDTDQRAVSTQGTLTTRYFVADGATVSGLSVAIDTVLADAARLGITFRLDEVSGGPQLYYDGDGESEGYPPPDGWRVLLAAEAARIGWHAPDADLED